MIEPNNTLVKAWWEPRFHGFLDHNRGFEIAPNDPAYESAKYRSFREFDRVTGLWNGKFGPLAERIIPSKSSLPTDPNVESVRAKLLQRSQVGIAKYGGTTEALTPLQALRHAQEELLDGAVYLEAAIRRMEEQG